MTWKAQELKAIKESLKDANNISIPLGRPTEKQMESLRKHFPEWDISIDPYDIFGAYVDFKRKA